MSLRGSSIEQDLTLPDGRTAQLRIAMAHDSYLPEREEETVILELRIDGHVAAPSTPGPAPKRDKEPTRPAREWTGAPGPAPIGRPAPALERYVARLR